MNRPGGLKVMRFINRPGGLKAMHACTITSRCVCVFVVGVCVCFWLCLLVVSNASMIDLLLYVITVGKIEIWNQWFDVQF